MDPLTLLVLAGLGVFGFSILRQRQVKAGAVSQEQTPPQATPAVPPPTPQLGAALGGLVAGIAITSIGSWMDKRKHAQESAEIARKIDGRMRSRAAEGAFDGMLAAGNTNGDIGDELDRETGPIDLRLKYARQAGDEIVSSMTEMYRLRGGERFSWKLGDRTGTGWFGNYLNARRVKIQAEIAAAEAAAAEAAAQNSKQLTAPTEPVVRF
jgi:hypothetical protein